MANTYLVNPCGLAYQSTTGVSQYAQATGMLISGRCNRTSTDFQLAQLGGAEHYPYFDFMERPNAPLCALDEAFYMGTSSIVPLWPLFGTNTVQRVNFAGDMMTDITVGSTWVTFGVNYIVTNVMLATNSNGYLYNGCFLDVIGARLFSVTTTTGTTTFPGADWTTWGTAEQNAWVLGCVDIVRQLDAKRRALRPDFKMLNNNLWTGDTAANLGTAGEPYVDGVCLEHHPSTSVANTNYAGRTTFSNLGHRRMLSIATLNTYSGTADALLWAQVQGITHVSNQASYVQVNSPPVPFNNINTGSQTTVIPSFPLVNPIGVVLMNPAGQFYRAGTAPLNTCALPVPNPVSPISGVLVNPTTLVPYRS